MKITVVGIGKVGSTVAFVLAREGLASELVLYNRTRQRAWADAVDIQHAVAFVPHRVVVRDGDMQDTADSDVIVMCAGVEQPRDLTDRNLLLHGNARVMEQLIPPLIGYSPRAIIVNVTNPVDVMCYHIWRKSELPWQQVIGTGTLIDSARFREKLSDQVGIHPIDLNAYILGEHGDSQFAALSVAVSGGEHIDATPARQQMVEDAKRSAWEVFQGKGYTNYAVAMAVQLVVESIVKDLRYTLPVSVLIDGFCDVRDVFLSIPAAIGRDGVHRRLEPDLDERDRGLFCKSAQVVRSHIENISGGG